MLQRVFLPAGPLPGDWPVDRNGRVMRKAPNQRRLQARTAKNMSLCRGLLMSALTTSMVRSSGAKTVLPVKLSLSILRKNTQIKEFSYSQIDR